MINILNKEEFYKKCRRKVSNMDKFGEETNFENKNQIEMLEKKNSGKQIKYTVKKPQQQATLRLI